VNEPQIEGAKILEVTVGFQQNYRPDPRDGFIYATKRMDMRVLITPTIELDFESIVEKCIAVCREKVLSSIDSEVKAAQAVFESEGRFD
jgi:hypothetical protein